MGWSLLIIRVCKLLVMLGLLLLLSGAVTAGDLTGTFFHGTVVKNLLTSKLFLLECPKALLFFNHCAAHLSLTDLLGALMHNIITLVLVQALEVVGLHAVRSQHGLLSGGVLSHEVVVKGVVLLVLGSILVRLPVSLVTVTLLSCQLEVCVLV